MTEIAEIERRMTAAFDRIGAGIDSVGGVDTSAIATMQAALDDEKMASAQLEERVRSLKDQHDAQLREVNMSVADRMETLEKEVAALRSEAQDAKAQSRQLRQSNQRLQASLQQLREAGMGGVEPQMLNQAMMSELDGLRAARAADRTEMNEILGALQPLLTEGEDA